MLIKIGGKTYILEIHHRDNSKELKSFWITNTYVKWNESNNDIS